MLYQDSILQRYQVINQLIKVLHPKPEKQLVEWFQKLPRRNYQNREWSDKRFTALDSKLPEGFQGIPKTLQLSSQRLNEMNAELKKAKTPEERENIALAYLTHGHLKDKMNSQLYSLLLPELKRLEITKEVVDNLQLDKSLYSSIDLLNVVKELRDQGIQLDLAKIDFGLLKEIHFHNLLNRYVENSSKYYGVFDSGNIQYINNLGKEQQLVVIEKLLKLNLKLKNAPVAEVNKLFKNTKETISTIVKAEYSKQSIIAAIGRNNLGFTFTTLKEFKEAQKTEKFKEITTTDQLMEHLLNTAGLGTIKTVQQFEIFILKLATEKTIELTPDQQTIIREYIFDKTEASPMNRVYLKDSLPEFYYSLLQQNFKKDLDLPRIVVDFQSNPTMRKMLKASVNEKRYQGAKARENEVIEQNNQLRGKLQHLQTKLGFQAFSLSMILTLVVGIYFMVLLD